MTPRPTHRTEHARPLTPHRPLCDRCRDAGAGVCLYDLNCANRERLGEDAQRGVLGVLYGIAS